MICNYSSTLIVNELAGSSFLHMWKVVEVHSMSEVKAVLCLPSVTSQYPHGSESLHNILRKDTGKPFEQHL